jgi:NitT/TauT family transport system ATP-binding protein
MAPLLVVWFGYGISSKIVISYLIAFFPIVISTLGGLSSTPPNLLEHFRALGASQWKTFWHLRFASALPYFIDGCKVAIPLAVIGAVIGEFVGSESGLGNLIMLSSASQRTALTFAATGRDAVINGAFRGGRSTGMVRVVAIAMSPPTERAATDCTLSAIAVHELSKSFLSRRGPVLALQDVSLEVQEGAFLSVLSPSGCGKSTLMRIVAGLITYESGNVAVRGRPVIQPRDEVGVVFQTPNLLPWRTVLGNLRLGLEMKDRLPSDIDARLAGMVRLLGLEGFERSYPHELSGGMQQRAALGQMLMLQPQILLMDEPFGAPDSLTRDKMNIELLRIWEEQRQTTLFVTHSIQEAVLLSDRVVVFSPRPGRIIEDIRIDFPRPRKVREVRSSQQFNQYVVRLGEIMGVV